MARLPSEASAKEGSLAYGCRPVCELDDTSPACPLGEERRCVAAAFDALESGRQFAPAVQDYIRQRGRAVTVAEGQTVTLDLPMGGIN